MLDKMQVTVDLDLSQALALISDQCAASGNFKAAQEARDLSRGVKGAIMHANLSGADIVCAACDALRGANRADLVAKMEVLIKSIKNGQSRQIFGNFIMGATVQKMLTAAGSAGANIIGIEDPRSGDVVPIAKISNT